MPVLQAASLSTERQQLAALEEERRGLLRQLEAETAAELARLDDRAKEEKLKQVAAVERAYQVRPQRAKQSTNGSSGCRLHRHVGVYV